MCACILHVQVRQQNADLMAAFHRREQLAAVKEEDAGERSSKGTGAAAGGGVAGTDGCSTPNTGSELGVSWQLCWDNLSAPLMLSADNCGLNMLLARASRPTLFCAQIVKHWVEWQQCC